MPVPLSASLTLFERSRLLYQESISEAARMRTRIGERFAQEISGLHLRGLTYWLESVPHGSSVLRVLDEAAANGSLPPLRNLWQIINDLHHTESIAAYVCLLPYLDNACTPNHDAIMYAVNGLRRYPGLIDGLAPKDLDVHTDCGAATAAALVSVVCAVAPMQEVSAFRHDDHGTALFLTDEDLIRLVLLHPEKAVRIGAVVSERGAVDVALILDCISADSVPLASGLL